MGGMRLVGAVEAILILLDCIHIQVCDVYRPPLSLLLLCMNLIDEFTDSEGGGSVKNLERFSDLVSVGVDFLAVEHTSCPGRGSGASNLLGLHMAVHIGLFANDRPECLRFTKLIYHLHVDEVDVSLWLISSGITRLRLSSINPVSATADS